LLFWLYYGNQKTFVKTAVRQNVDLFYIKSVSRSYRNVWTESMCSLFIFGCSSAVSLSVDATSSSIGCSSDSSRSSPQ